MSKKNFIVFFLTGLFLIGTLNFFSKAGLIAAVLFIVWVLIVLINTRHEYVFIKRICENLESKIEEKAIPNNLHELKGILHTKDSFNLNFIANLTNYADIPIVIQYLAKNYIFGYKPSGKVLDLIKQIEAVGIQHIE